MTAVRLSWPTKEKSRRQGELENPNKPKNYELNQALVVRFNKTIHIKPFGLSLSKTCMH